MKTWLSRGAKALLAGVLAPALAATPAPGGLAADPDAVGELISAVSLDVMSEAALEACRDMGVPTADAMREAWVAWREQHQLAPLRVIVSDVQRRRGSEAPSWSRLTEPMRQRVLSDPKPDAGCAALAADWRGPTMDATALYPRARAVAAALVQSKVVSRPDLPALAAGTVRGQVLLPSQVPALAAQRNGGWSSLSDEVALREHGVFHVKGLVERVPGNRESFRLVEVRGDRASGSSFRLPFNAEAWVGRELVLRGVLTSLRDYGATLASAEIVRDASNLTPSPLPAAPLARREVLLQRVMTRPGQGLKAADLAAVVLHGQGNYNNGTSWDEDVRFLLRDGTCYRRTEMPPDQLDVAASRRLEPQQWCRWRSAGAGYEFQEQDDDGRPAGGWAAAQHRALPPWSAGTAIDGYFKRSRFDGSLFLGGRSSTQGMRFSRDGRFERSYHAMSGSGTLAATLNNTVITSASHADGQGSSAATAGTVGTGTGSVGATTRQRQDDGASRRGRYRFEGYAVVLVYDDGHEERLLSFPTQAGPRGVYVGSGSLMLDS